MVGEALYSFRGTHGTTVGSASKIQGEGFVIGKGRCGPGVYLWAEGPFALDLARVWHTQKCRDLRLKEIPENSCCILNIVGQTELISYLDCEHPEMRGALEEYLYSTGGEEDPGDIMAAFIYDIEQETKRKIKLLRKQITVPRGFGDRCVKSYRRELLSSCAISYAIRDLDIIKQIEVVG